jgi:hypothetical protein
MGKMMKINETKIPNQSHEWRGAWNRPMQMDEDSLHPFTVARMTDHNVRGTDDRPIYEDDPSQYMDPTHSKEKLNSWEAEGGFQKNLGGI